MRQGKPNLAVELGERVADPPGELAAAVAHELEPGERMILGAFATATQRFGAAQDLNQAKALAEQAGDLARRDQIPEGAGATGGRALPSLLIHASDGF